MSLTARDIAEITRLLEESSFDELELEIDGLKIHLRRGGVAAARAPSAAAVPASAAQTADAAPAQLDEPGLAPVRAPLLGTFYRAPKPGRRRSWKPVRASSRTASSASSRS